MTPGVRPLVAGNWKMNGLRASLSEIAAMRRAVDAGEAGAADFGHLVGDRLAEHVADAPDDETDDDEAENDRHDETANYALRRLPHPIEHGFR